MSIHQWGIGLPQDGQSGGTEPYYPCPTCGKDMGHGAGLGMCCLCMMKLPRPVDPRDAELTALRAERDEAQAKARASSLAALRSGDEAIVLMRERDAALGKLGEAEKDSEGARSHLALLLTKSAPQCRPFEHLSGVVSQIDNLLCGLRTDRSDALALVERYGKALEEIASVGPLGRMTPSEAYARAIARKALYVAPVAGQRGEGGDVKIGDKVRKLGGDYRFDGTVVAVFHKLSGEIRIVVEDDRGVLFVANTKNYEVIS